MKNKLRLIITFIIISCISFNSVQAEESIIKAGIEKNEYLTLEQCLSLALKNNPKIKAAISNTEIFKSRIGQSKADYFPRIEISSGYTRVDPLVSQKGFPDRVYNSFSSGISLNQLIYDFGRTSLDVKIKKDEFDSSKADLKDIVNSVIYNVKERYFALLYAMEQKQVIEDTVEQYNQHYEQAKAFYEIGTKPKIDMMIAQTNLSNAKLDLIRANNSVLVSLAKLNNSMGMPEAPEYFLRDKLSYEKYPFSFGKLVNIAYESRPDLESANLQGDATKREISLAKRNYFPTLDGFAGLSGGGAEFYDDNSWNAGATFKIPLLNIYETKKKVVEARAKHDKSLADIQYVKQLVYLDIKEAYAELIEAEERIPASKTALAQAQENYDLASGRYKAGVGNPIELKDAEMTFRMAKLTNLEALHDYNLALAKLEKAMGKQIFEFKDEL